MFDLTTTQLIVYVGIIILALLMGPIVNMIVYRLPILLFHEWHSDCENFLKTYKDPDKTVTKKVLTLKSACAACGEPVTCCRHVPVIGYFLSKRSCQACGVAFSLQSVMIDLLTIVLTLFIFSHFSLSKELFPALIFTWLLLALTFIDLDHQLLVDKLVFPLLWIGMIVNSQSIFATPVDAIWGVVFGYVILVIPAWLYRKMTHTQGVGEGDFKFIAALCAWLGYQAIPPLLIVSLALFIVVRVCLYISPEYRKRYAAVAFGPFLTCVGWVLLLWPHYTVLFNTRFFPRLVH